jgi:hypothetical protein
MFGEHRRPWFGNRAGNTERFLPNEDARMPRAAYVPLLLTAQTFAIADRCLRLKKTSHN